MLHLVDLDRRNGCTLNRGQERPAKGVSDRISENTETKTITVEDKKTGQTDKKMTKTQAEDEYKRYVHDLRYDEKILEVLAGKVPARPKPRT